MSNARSFLTVNGCAPEALTVAEVERLLILAMSSDQLLSDCLEFLEASRPDLKQVVDDTVEGVMYFCEDSACAALQLRCRSAIRKTEKERSLRALKEASGGVWEGFELQNRSSTQFAVLGPDASEPGRVRATLFDSAGMSGHRTRKDYDQLVRELLSEGYRPAPGALDALACTSTFIEGMGTLARLDQLKRQVAGA